MPRSGKPRLAVTRLEDRTTPDAVGLDPAFATAGRFLLSDTRNVTGGPLFRRIAPLADGRTVVATTATDANGNTDFLVFRLTPAGAIDTTFGADGFARIGFDLGGTNGDVLNALAVRADGTILVAGSAERAAGDTDFAVARLTAAGALDTTFDGDGKATVFFNSGGQNRDAATGVAVDSLGRVVLGGYAEGLTGGDFDFAAVRLTPAGALDSTFGPDGRATVAFDLVAPGGSKEDKAAAVGIGPGNTVVLAGTASNGKDSLATAVARLLENGTPDPGLNGTGRRTFPAVLGTTAVNSASALLVGTGGRILLAGSVSRESLDSTDMYVGRLAADGSPDATFGGGGFAAVAFDRGGVNADFGNALTVDAAGNVLVAGSVQVGANDFSYGVARLTPAGAIDAEFDIDGRFTVAFDRGGSKADAATDVAVLPDGRILLAGVVEVAAGTYDAGLARLRVGAAAQPSVLVAGGSPTGETTTFAVGPDGKYTAGPTAAPFGPAAVVRPAAADVTGDGVEDLIFAVGPGGGSLVRVVDGTTGQDLAPPTPTFEPAFTGGLFVAAADVDGDGIADVVVSPDVGGGGRVQAFAVRGGALVRVANFFGIDDPAFRGGARVAAGDVDGDGRADLVVGAGFGGGPRVAVFDGRTLTRAGPARLTGDFFAFPGADAERLRNGVFVAAGDVTADGRAELIFGGGPGGGPRVFVLDGATVLAAGPAAAQAAPVGNFFAAGDSQSRGGVRVAVKDADADGRADVVTGSGDGQPGRVRVYPGAAFPAAGEPAASQDFPVFDGAVLATGVFVG